MPARRGGFVTLPLRFADRTKGVFAMASNGNCSPYIGKIGNNGNQKVDAPIKPGTSKGQTIVHKGEDLRNGGGK